MVLPSKIINPFVITQKYWHYTICLLSSSQEARYIIFKALPNGLTFGIADSYEQVLNDKSWNDFIYNRLVVYKNQITAANIFDPALTDRVIFIAKKLDNNFKAIKSTPFLWDASERNVLVHDGKISGIVDVDEICFGDPLLVIALTHTCLKLERLDTLYTDFWAQELHLNSDAQDRLNFYYLFYVIAFMRKHALQTINGKKNMFEVDMLVSMFDEALQLQKK